MRGEKFIYRLICEKISLENSQIVSVYGIQAETHTLAGDFVVDVIPDISTHRLFVEHARSLLERCQADPIHFHFLIEDFLAWEWEWMQENDVGNRKSQTEG